MVTNDAGSRTDSNSNGWVPFSYNTWFMLTAVLNRSTNTQQLIKNNYESSSSVTPSGGTYQNTSLLSIGGDYGTGTYWTNGQIPTVMIYNRALSAVEIRQNFNAHRGRYNL
jgi:hypothetical protein